MHHFTPLSPHTERGQSGTVFEYGEEWARVDEFEGQNDAISPSYTANTVVGGWESWN